MLLDQPVFTIYNLAGDRIDWLRAPVSYRVTPRHVTAGVGDAEVVVQGGDWRGPYLWQPGARLQISMRGEHVLGGRVTSATHEGPESPTWTVRVTDDAVILDQILAWPNPAAALSAQASVADVRNGKLESVAKTLIAANAAKQGLSVGISTDQGRGPTVTTTARMVPLRDVLLPHLKAAGMNLVAVWSETQKQVVVDVVQQSTYPIQLATQSATITSYTLTRAAPTITRVVMGDAGDGTSRGFTAAVNTTAEAAWGIRAEVFRAAKTAEEITDVAAETLTDGAPRSGMSLTLSETDTVRYGGPGGLHVGDQVTLRVGDLQITDTVREATITGGPGQPLTVQPAVGGWQDSPSHVLAEAVRRLGSMVRRSITH